MKLVGGLGRVHDTAISYPTKSSHYHEPNKGGDEAKFNNKKSSTGSEVHVVAAGRLLGDKGIGAVAMMLPSAKPTLVNFSDNR